MLNFVVLLAQYRMQQSQGQIGELLLYSCGISSLLSNSNSKRVYFDGNLAQSWQEFGTIMTIIRYNHDIVFTQLCPYFGTTMMVVLHSNNSFWHSHGSILARSTHKLQAQKAY